MSYPPLTTLGAVVEACYVDALKAWQHRRAPGTRLADLYANDVTSATIETTLFPRGKVSIAVIVRGRRHDDDQAHLFRVRRESSNRYIREGDSLDL